MLTPEQKKEIIKLVDSEFKEYSDRDFKKDLKKKLKSDSDVREYVVDIIRKCLQDYAKFTWLRSSVWSKEIKG